MILDCPAMGFVVTIRSLTPTHGRRLRLQVDFPDEPECRHLVLDSLAELISRSARAVRVPEPRKEEDT